MDPRSVPTSGLAAPRGSTLAAVDGLAIVAFVVTGAISHHDAAFAVIAARNLVPLGILWSAAAIVIGTYRRRSWGSLLLTWAVAVPAGLLLRSWWVGEPSGGELATFLIVGGAFTLLFLLAGRVLVILGSRASSRRRVA
jgi:Protein of unknown function (DUF3054)